MKVVVAIERGVGAIDIIRVLNREVKEGDTVTEVIEPGRTVVLDWCFKNGVNYNIVSMPEFVRSAVREADKVVVVFLKEVKYHSPVGYTFRYAKEVGKPVRVYVVG